MQDDTHDDDTEAAPGESDQLAEILERLEASGSGGRAPQPPDLQALWESLGGASREVEGQGSPPSSTPRAPKRRSSGRSAIADFGVDLTAQAREEPPVFVGRDEEIETVLEALCRRRKANPLILGPPGSGKTAVVEAVAARIASDQVPSPLKGQRLIAISTGALIAGGGMVGEVESRIEVLLQEARECDVILFFDEVHTLMGAGGREGTGDVASLIKPALSRGDIRCIAATTDDEYHRYIKNDAALDRRFLPIRLRELSPQESRHVLALLRDAEGALEPHVSDVVLDAMIERMQRVLPNRHFPDKAIDLFDQVIAHARVRGLTEVTVATVDAVAERMAGIPASPALRLERLSDLLRRGNWCREEDIEALTERLSVTLRGLDLNMERPNLVADVIAPSLERVRSFAREMARTLYGDPHRVIELDGSTFGTGASLTGLVGASAGYVGYGDRHLLAPLAEQPCHVLLISGMEQADPAVRELLVQAIDSGWITDQRNRRIPFSEAIVLQWVAPAAARSTVGFTSSEAMVAGPSSSSGWRVDLSISLATGDPVALALEMISRRWAETEGITIRWDPSVSAWASGVANVAQFLDQELTRSLWRLLGGQPERRGSTVLVAVRNGQVVLVPD